MRIALTKVCLRSEHEARDQLARQWGEFAPADKTRCVGKTHMGGPPSYIEVLTCLELARDARKLPKDDNTGLSTGMLDALFGSPRLGRA